MYQSQWWDHSTPRWLQEHFRRYSKNQRLDNNHQECPSSTARGCRVTNIRAWCCPYQGHLPSCGINVSSAFIASIQKQWIRHDIAWLVFRVEGQKSRFLVLGFGVEIGTYSSGVSTFNLFSWFSIVSKWMEKMIPWLFSLGHNHKARPLSGHVFEIKMLPATISAFY